MNNKLLEKLLKIIGKTQAVTIQTPLPSIGCCCYNHQQYVDDSINRIDARMRDPRCAVLLTTMAECGRRKGTFYKGFSCNTPEVDNILHPEPPESPGGGPAPWQFSCCTVPPPTNTPGGQFVPIWQDR